MKEQWATMLVERAVWPAEIDRQGSQLETDRDTLRVAAVVLFAGNRLVELEHPGNRRLVAAEIRLAVAVAGIQNMVAMALDSVDN